MPIQLSRGGDDSPLPPLSHTRPFLAEERVLKEMFDAEYEALSAEARDRLGSDAAALTPKVVEGAFVRAWDSRALFSTASELRQFLVEDIHHAAARALSRRAAAHRFGGHEASKVAHNTEQPSAHQSWGHIQHALHGEAHSPQVLAEAAAHSRHEAASHIASATKDKTTWAAIAIGTIVVVALIGGVFALDRLGADDKIAGAVNASDARVVNSLPGQVGVVTLDDGSIVRLAPESKLSIPRTFGAKIRAVKLEGSANFEVAAGRPTELQVHAGDLVAVAKGTQFMVQAYPADSSATIVVSEGSVEVRQNGKAVQTLTAGQALMGRTGMAPRAATPPERDEADAWRTGTLAMTDRPLRDVLPLLRRWYGLTITVQPESLQARKVTMRAPLDSSRQALRAVEQSTGLEFGYIGQNMVFREPSGKLPMK